MLTSLKGKEVLRASPITVESDFDALFDACPKEESPITDLFFVASFGSAFPGT